MIHSMTGFDLSEFDNLSWELRSVNHRYLELNFKLPEDCRHLEAALKTDPWMRTS